MAPRANWKGFLRLSLVTCPVALYPATSESEKISFNQLNRKTGHRIKYLKVDADTGDEVANEDIVKGYMLDRDTFIEVTKDELENVAPEVGLLRAREVRGPLRDRSDRSHQPEALGQADHAEGAARCRQRRRSDGGAAPERRPGSGVEARSQEAEEGRHRTEGDAAADCRQEAGQAGRRKEDVECAAEVGLERLRHSND